MAGAGYKLFNTGDVLTAAQVNTYLMEQTVMVFANAAARTTALSGVVSEGMISYLKDTNAVEVYDGSNWVSSDDPNAIQNTIVDAKGDLISASAADTPARLAVGNNGETLVADSSTSTGLRWTGANQQNPVLNSAFDIWQRGTSIASGAAAPYTADRWQIGRSSLVAGMTISRQATGDSTNLPFIQYCARVQRDSGNTSTAQIYFMQSFETANSVYYAGKTITISFYARRGANYSEANNNLGVRLDTGTGTDQNVYTGYTGSSTPISSPVILTTTWQRFSVSGGIPSTTTEMGLLFNWLPAAGTAGANDYFEITGVQIDVGSVALPYRRNSATLAGELAACQRYYWRFTSNGVAASVIGQIGIAYNTTDISAVFKCPVTMRTTPTSLDYSNVAVLDVQASRVNVSSVTILDSSPDNVRATLVASGLTAQRSYLIYNQSGVTGYIGYSAEL